MTRSAAISAAMDASAQEAFDAADAASHTTPADESSGPDPNPPQFQIRDWAQIVARIRDGDAGAMEELYAIFARGIRYFLLRNLGAEELDDRVHDCFVIVTEAIRNGELRDPARLMGYVRTV